MANTYRPMLRPASSGSLPSGVAWDYVEAPYMHGLANRPDLPTSKYRYGVIQTDRPLTPEELATCDLQPV